MTHSLKVGQVARRLAEYIKQKCSDEELASAGGLDPDVAETAGLCHDIGHPPFGHAAEEELQIQLENTGIDEFDGFEGNAQSFRIVTKTSRRDHHTPGLDLTAASLAGVLKYPWARAAKNVSKKNKKFGFYQDEASEFKHARAFLPKGDERQSLEASVMDWADDVSYAVHDIEDAFRARLIPLDRLYRDDLEKERFIAWTVAHEIRRAVNKKESAADKKMAHAEATRRSDTVAKSTADILTQLADLPYAPRQAFDNSNEDIGRLHRYSSTLLKRYLNVGQEGINVCFSNKDDSRLFIPEWMRSQVSILKSLMVYYVYESPALVAQQVGQRLLIAELFRRLYEATAPDKRSSGLIPPPFQSELKPLHQEEGSALKRGRARLAIDVITSLTEQQALDYYKRLSGHWPGSIHDRILY